MQPARRDFLIQTSAVSTAALLPASANASHAPELSSNAMGVLVDLNDCIGCRLCEYACKKDNGIDPGPLKSYDDQSVFRVKRRMGTNAFTVVNAYEPAEGKKVFVKNNCLHCNHPACASACIVGALQKQENGAVVYDAWKCIGCRYCMVACPFQVPMYEYDKVLTPRVRKCEFCYEKHTSRNEPPACVTECPRQAMIFGRRDDLLKVAHERITKSPDRYVPHVYGEHEAGGTSWMYLSPVPFEQAGFLQIGQAAPPALTEAIQHGVFKYWIAPVGWYSFLAGMMWWTGRKHRLHTHSQQTPHQEKRALPLPVLSEWAGKRALCGAATGNGSRWNDEEAPVDDISPIDDAKPAPQPSPSVVGEGGNHHPAAKPVKAKLLTPGVWLLIAMVLVGVAFGLYRFIMGLAATTNLTQEYPWGLWIAMDVGSGIALAGGGFVTAALVHVFHREKYHAVARSALLTALLGYTFYVPGLLADLGRWYNLWHPILPSMWQGNSVLFEVGICVMLYLNVQYLELTPIILERLMGERRFAKWEPLLNRIHALLEKAMPAFLVAGVTLSTFHQSSLGNLMVIAPYKLHALWWTPLSPLFFLLSAIMVGLPMVIFTLLFASWSLKREPEMHVLGPLARWVPPVLGAYLLLKIGDVIWRGAGVHLADVSAQSISWVAEMLLGVAVPMVLLSLGRIRQSPKWLAITCLMVVLGVVLNRLNCFVIGYFPPYTEKVYFPSITELMVSMGLVAALLLTYRVAVTYLPILEPRKQVAR